MSTRRNPTLAVALAVVSLGFGGPGYATEDAPVEATEETGRSPADLSEAERSRMVGAANQYAVCLANAADERSGTSDDPRVVADAAMGACESSYQAIGSLLTELRLGSTFAEGFIRTSRDRATRHLLTVLMERKGRAQ